MIDQFAQGGIIVWFILICFLFGTWFAVERFWTLSHARIDVRKFLVELKDALDKGGVSFAIEVCTKTPGPLANVLHAGLLRGGNGIDQVKRAIETAGYIETGILENNLTWLVSIFSITPILGFLGTLIGMINAFDLIARANDLAPAIIAGSVAETLFTTALGLGVAIPIKLAHRYCVWRIDVIVADMEESAGDFVNALVERKII